jgi:hypothetical protein
MISDFEILMSARLERDRLKEENAKLKKFFFEAMNIAWDGSDWGGDDIQEFAADCELGIFDEYKENFIVRIDK